MLKVVKELDAFPKVPESYQETSISGGGISIVVFIIILLLVISEIGYYTATDLKFDYNVDTEYDGKLKINIDMTIAMKCSSIGADVLDLTGQNADMFGKLDHEPVPFELTPSQQQYFNMVQNMNSYIREEYHAIHKLLWSSGYISIGRTMPQRDPTDTTPKNGCRVHGTLVVNKVAGNFHVTAGKSVPVIPRGHAHLSLMVSEKDYNFSHRIDHFSFGEITPGIVNPLDGELKISNDHYHMYQYFMQVVPTHVQTMSASLDTCQFAVREQNRTINHAAGSHGTPGIFIKYDLSSLKIAVREEHKPYWQFLVRLCGIVGGIFATSGLMHNLIGFFVDVVCCRYKVGKYKVPLPQQTKTSGTDSTPQQSLQSGETSNLINPLIQADMLPHKDYSSQSQEEDSLRSPGVNLVVSGKSDSNKQ